MEERLWSSHTHEMQTAFIWVISAECSSWAFCSIPLLSLAFKMLLWVTDTTEFSVFSVFFMKVFGCSEHEHHSYRCQKSHMRRDFLWPWRDIPAVPVETLGHPRILSVSWLDQHSPVFLACAINLVHWAMKRWGSSFSQFCLRKWSDNRNWSFADFLILTLHRMLQSALNLSLSLSHTHWTGRL